MWQPQVRPSPCSMRNEEWPGKVPMTLSPYQPNPETPQQNPHRFGQERPVSWSGPESSARQKEGRKPLPPHPQYIIFS